MYKILSPHRATTTSFFSATSNRSFPNTPLPQLLSATQILHRPLDIASAFNEYFHSVFSQSNYTLPPLRLFPSPCIQLHSITIDPHDVVIALTHIDPSKDQGCENLHPLVIRNCAHSLHIPMCNLFNKSLQTQVTPAEWKIHKIFPVQVWVPKRTQTHILIMHPLQSPRDPNLQEHH